MVLYDPALHAVHEPPSGPVHPRSQVQSTTASLAEGESEFDGHAWHRLALAPIIVENLPASHSVHAASPALSLYLPATHCVQEPPSGPVQPTLHVHCVTMLLASGECELALHVVHTAALVAPTIVEYLPAEQLRHTASPPMIFTCVTMHTGSAVLPSRSRIAGAVDELMARLQCVGKLRTIGAQINGGPYLARVFSRHTHIAKRLYLPATRSLHRRDQWTRHCRYSQTPHCSPLGHWS